MPYFGRRSKKNLATCDKKLQKVFNEVIKQELAFLNYKFFSK